MVNVPHSKHFTGHFTKKNLINPLTYTLHSGIKTPCMAMRLVVATTEATDTTRVRDPFRTTANVSEDLVSEAPRRSLVGCRVQPIGS